MNNDIKSKIFWTKQSLFRKKAFEYYKGLLLNQNLSKDEIFNINWNKRKKLLDFAYSNVPFYKNKFMESGFNPSEITCPDDWKYVPVLTKDELINCRNELVSTLVDESCLIKSTTGGSTGQPVEVFHDKRYPQETLGWRMLNWWGIDPGSDAAFVWRVTKKGLISPLINKMIWWPTKRLLLDAASIRPSDMNIFIDYLNRIKPQVLQGYVGAIHHLAMFIEANGVEVYSPKAVWVTSSPVSDVQRLIIEKVFQAPLYDQYGCGEVFWLAAQCNLRGGLHIFYDARHIEFVDDSMVPFESEEFGSTLITDLENYAFPIIRYANGDKGRLINKTCDCGNRLPLMDSVKGRTTDLIYVPDGSVVSGDYLTTIFDDYPESVKAFQVVQHNDFSVTIRCVPNASYPNFNKAINEIITRLRIKVSKKINIFYETVDKIEDDRGKTKFVVSEMNRNKYNIN